MGVPVHFDLIFQPLGDPTQPFDLIEGNNISQPDFSYWNVFNIRLQRDSNKLKTKSDMITGPTEYVNKALFNCSLWEKTMTDTRPSSYTPAAVIPQLGWHKLSAHKDYLEKRYAYIKETEHLGFPLKKDKSDLLAVYADDKGIPTIGVGFNLHGKPLRDAVLDTIYGSGKDTPGTVKALVDGPLRDVLTSTYTGSQADMTRAVRNAVDAKLAKLRTDNPSLTFPDLMFIDKGQITGEDQVKTLFNDRPEAAPLYEAQLTNLMTRTVALDYDVPVDTQERIALLSLA